MRMHQSILAGRLCNTALQMMHMVTENGVMIMISEHAYVDYQRTGHLDSVFLKLKHTVINRVQVFPRRPGP
jgi:hypothetical protein